MLKSFCAPVPRWAKGRALERNGYGAMKRPTKTARELLDAKRSEVSGVVNVAPSDTVLFSLKLMREKDIGAVIVLDNGKLAGILTERDYARDVELEGRTAKDCLVQQIMTVREIICAKPGHSIQQCHALGH